MSAASKSKTKCYCGQNGDVIGQMPLEAKVGNPGSTMTKKTCRERDRETKTLGKN